MSKKKRKTRKEKEVAKSHDFISESKETRIEPNDIKEIELKKPSHKIEDRAVYDLKKVTFLIAIMFISILILAFIVYRTDIFNGLFSKFNISY